MHKASNVATIILAGGQGTRLHPLTLHHSKPAVSYAGRYRLIDIPISSSINSNFRQIFVIAQYLSNELQHHIQQTYHFDVFNPGSVDVLTPQENERGEKQWFKGTADAVRKNLSTLLKSSAEYFLILSGDQLYNINFQSMVEFAEKTNSDLTIASIPITGNEALRMGILKIDQDQNITQFIEKPQHLNLIDAFVLDAAFFKKRDLSYKKDHFLASMGIYIFKRETLIELLEKDSREDFGFHLIDTAVKTKKTTTFVYSGYWEDIGTIASYYEANLVLTRNTISLNTYDEHNPIYTRPTYLPGPKIHCTKITQSIICEGSVIEADEITGSIIGLRSRIKKGTKIRDTVLMGNHFYMPPLQEKKPIEHEFGIGENCIIEKAIIDEHVKIGNHVKLINKNKLETYDGKNLFIREGIIIVPSGAEIEDFFEI